VLCLIPLGILSVCSLVEHDPLPEMYLIYLMFHRIFVKICKFAHMPKHHSMEKQR